MLILFATGVVAGLAVAVWGSRAALDAATELGVAMGLSPFVIGVTIVAVGTDLPEVANSIMASAGGHGDLNVGDSIGSVVTQATLVLGIICLSGELRTSRPAVVTAGTLTVLALVVGAALFADEEFSRFDGLTLLAVWIVGTIVMQRPEARGTDTKRATITSVRRQIARTIFWLLIVGAGAAMAVEMFIRAAEEVGAPEFLASFFVLSLGTSLPELVVALRAMQRREGELALGDLFGSSFVDASLSPGIGPLLFPTALSAGVDRTNVIAALLIAVVTVVIARNATHRWATGLTLLLLYAVLYPALLS